MSTVTEEKPKEQRVWSVQKQDIFRWFKNAEDDPGYNSDHLVVRARAGTGKTTTIIEGVNRAPESSILLCAFNKKIADDLTKRISNPHAEAKTLHSVGYQAIKRQWRGMPVSKGTERADSLTALVTDVRRTPKPIVRLITQLHTKGRDMLPLEATGPALLDLALFFDLVPDEGWAEYSLEWVVTQALRAIQYARDNDPTYDIGIDFADMIFLPLAWNLLSKDYDMVVVDEAQDLSKAQIEIAQRLCSGRICVVGDDKQAIYGFRGADSKSLDRLKSELGAAELPLTTTYRCCQSVVRKAQALVPDILAGVDNPEGVVDAIEGLEGLLEAVEPGQFILSRLNAPLVMITLGLLKRKKRARMAGRDIGAGIQAILRKLKLLDSTPVVELLKRLQEWETKNVTRYASYGQLELVERTRDQAGMIFALAETSETISDLQNRIEWLFSDDVQDHEQILCSSVHKAKGLEAERVYVLQESFYRRGVTPEEQNIHYVAVTRAKSHLTFVTGIMAQRLQ